MMADQTRDAAVAREEFVERRRGNTHRSIYGLGMWREEIDVDGEVTLCSSPGWAGTYPWIDKKHDIRGLIVAHVTDGAAKTFSSFWSSPVLMNMVRAELDWNLPRTLPGYASGTARANGADIAWEAAGSGPPVILIHGHSFDRRMWGPQFAQLSKKYRVIRYDIRGYGLSDMPVEGQSFLHADDVVALMDALKIPRANVVGLSLGAYIVADLLALHPDRLLTATMASGAVFNGPASHELGPQERALRLKEIESLRMNGVEKLKVSWRENLLREVKDQDTRALVTAMIADWSAWQPLHIEPPFLLGLVDGISSTVGNPPPPCYGSRESVTTSAPPCAHFSRYCPTSAWRSFPAPATFPTWSSQRHSPQPWSISSRQRNLRQASDGRASVVDREAGESRANGKFVPRERADATLWLDSLLECPSPDA